ncbi:MAG: ATP-grasp domain-containing protein, partial [Alkalispirochaeta sp.]
AAEEAGVPVPETQSFDDVDDWDRPLIVKPRYAILAPEYVDFFDPTDCDGQNDPIHHQPGPPPDRDEILEYMLGHVPIVQQYIPIEHEFSVRALYDRGEAVKTSVRRQIRAKSYKGGASVYRELVDRPEIERLGRQLLDHLDWHGLATVQFIESTDGTLWLVEINPRVWTSITLDVRAGADYPYFYWALATGQRERIIPDHQLDYSMHNIYGELQYLRSILTETESNADRPSLPDGVSAVLSSTYRDPRFDYLVRDDPIPLLRGIQYRFLGGG